MQKKNASSAGKDEAEEDDETDDVAGAKEPTHTVIEGEQTQDGEATLPTEASEGDPAVKQVDAELEEVKETEA